MTKPILCLYHAACMDGFTAAWAVHQRFPDAEFIPVSYGEEPPEVLDRDVVIVDFSYSLLTLDATAGQARTLLVLDHHATAERNLAGLPSTGEYYLDHRDPAPTYGALFDKARSGAKLAWDYFHPGTMTPEIVQYVQDRDLWRFKLRGTKEIHAYLSSYEMTFDRWDKTEAELLRVGGWDRITDEGGAILRQHAKQVREAVEATRRTMVIGGHSVPVANVPYFMASDAGHLLGAGVPFAATYVDTPKGRVFSLRSSPEGLDVSKVAEQYGGGGHKHAARFSCELGWEGEPSCL